MESSWYSHCRDAVYLMLCKAFRLDPDGDEALARFVPAYTEDVTTPQAIRTANVCYFSLSVQQGTEYDYISLKHRIKKNVDTTTITKPIPVHVLLTFYGPDADGNAEHFITMFKWDNGCNSPRAALRKLNIVPSGQPGRPVAVHETEGTHIRRRCDIEMNLLYTLVDEYADSFVKMPPEITPLIEYTT